MRQETTYSGGLLVKHCTERAPLPSSMLQVLVAERGPLVFVFNFSPFHDYEGLKVICHALPPPLPLLSFVLPFC